MCVCKNKFARAILMYSMVRGAVWWGRAGGSDEGGRKGEGKRRRGGRG